MLIPSLAQAGFPETPAHSDQLSLVATAGRGLTNIASRPILVVAVGRVHRIEQSARAHQDRWVLVADNTQDQEPVRLSVVGGERRVMPAPLLPDSLP